MKKLLPILISIFLLTLTAHAQVARWKFNNDLTDASANAINGTAVGTPTYSTDSKEGGYSLVLNGSPTTIDFGNPTQVPGGTAAKSISCWAKTTTVSGQHYIVSYGTASQYKSMSIGMNGTTLTAGAYNDEISVNTFWAVNTWHHLVLTYDGTTAILYADGTQVASVAKAWNLTKNKVWVGHNVNGNWYWTGQIDDVRIYDVALSSTQVTALAAIPPAPTSPSATVASSTSINLGWTDASTTETGFAIERSTTSGSGYTLVTTTAANATSFTDSGLSPNTAYYYRIRAVADNANSSYTSEVTTTTYTLGASARWKLNGNANDAVGSANGTLIGSPSYNTTNVVEGSQSLTLNGTNQYVSITSLGFPKGTSLRTISGWIRPGSTAAGNHYAFCYGSPNNQSSMYFGISGTSVIGGATGGTDLSGGTVAVNTWYHVALTYDGTTATLYLNGSQIATGARTWNLVAGDANIGRHTGNAGYWNGQVDDIRVDNSVLSSGSILPLATLPPTPTSPSATAASSTSINLSWTDASTTETGFAIERSTTSGSGYTLVTTTAANATSFSDTGLTTSTAYYYRMRAIADNANSAYTSQFTATTSGGGFNAPTGLTAGTITGTSIQINWTDATTGETGFQVERSLTTNDNYSLVTTTAANAITYTDTGLKPWTKYYYRVRATNGTSQTAYTTEIHATTLALPAGPYLVTATPQSLTSISLAWNDTTSNETGFQVLRSLVDGSGYTLITTTAANATSYTDTGLTAGFMYYYEVLGVNSNGVSVPGDFGSFYASAEIPTDPPVAPSDLNVTTNSSSITLTWTDNSSNETGFSVERSTNSSSGFVSIFTTPANQTTMEDVNVFSNQTYYYRVQAVNPAGGSSYSNYITAMLSGLTAICFNVYCDGWGNVGIGTSTVPSGYRLAVRGKMISEGLQLDLQTAWPDYVFDNGYKLRDLPSLRSYINKNRHLPGIPTEAEVDKNGIDVGEMNVKLVEKIEELSLYVIQMEERIQALENENKTLKSGSKGNK